MCLSRKVLILTFIVLLPAVVAAKKRFGDRIVICGDDIVQILDQSEGWTPTPNVVWQWSFRENGSDLPAEYGHRLRTFDDCKPVDHGRRILATSSSDATLLIDIKTRRVLFYAYTPMAHSAELLPGGRIVVALSTHRDGNRLEVYDADSSEKPLFADSLYSAHGVVWNAKRRILYALGYDELRAYELKDWKTDKPKLVCRQVWKLPSIGGHDLTPIGKDKLVVTVHEGPFVFDMNTGEFHPFAPLANRPHVKSLNYDPRSGRTVYTIAEESWWTHNIYSLSPDHTIGVGDMKLYKVRCF